MSDRNQGQDTFDAMAGTSRTGNIERDIQAEISSEADRHVQRLRELREQQQRDEAEKAKLTEQQRKHLQQQQAMQAKNKAIQEQLQKLTLQNDEKYPHVDQSHIRDISKRTYPRPPNRTPLGTNQPHHPRVKCMTEYLRPHIVFVIMPFLQDWERQNWLHAAMLGPLFVPKTVPPGHPNYRPHFQNIPHSASWGLSIKQQQIQREKHRQQMLANGASVNAQGQIQVNLNPQELQVFRSLRTQQQRQNYLRQVHQHRMRMRQNAEFAQQVVKQGEMPRRGQVLTMAADAGDINTPKKEPQTVQEHMELMAKEEAERKAKEEAQDNDERTEECKIEEKDATDNEITPKEVGDGVATFAVTTEDDTDNKDNTDDNNESKPASTDETSSSDPAPVESSDDATAASDKVQDVKSEEKPDSKNAEEKSDDAATEKTDGQDGPKKTDDEDEPKKSLQIAPSPDILPDYQVSNPTMARPVSTTLFDGNKSAGKGEAADNPDAPPEHLIFPERPRIQLNSQLGIVDPHTLLERLNSRRLYKRVNAKDFPGLTYSKNKNTAMIAKEEWEEILGKSRDSLPFVNPPKYELMLFSPINQPVAILASYPRSGNSLMRTLYERTTVRVTGSDMRGGLTKHDLVGEAAVGNGMVQFVKTHFPERRGTPPFKASSVILLVRNPYDAIDSYFNLMMTSTHTTSVSAEVREKNKAAFEEMALKEIQVWRDFHEYWLAQQIPTLIVRYEDLTRHTDKVMGRVLEHALNVNNMHFFHRRIEHCFAAEKIEKLGSYKPRSGGIGKALSKYSPELLQKMNVGIVETMQKLGYGTFLVPDKEQWDLTPLPGYATKLSRPRGTVIVNQGDIVRTQERQTNWGRIRRQMGIKDNNGQMCQCWRCKEQGMN